ncbi:MAG: YggS family pyridoxal phosphate-dependent enzyme [Peptococcaceae bacterium]|nr:YggS family pyridoxal phosphate-dependent enzyme [Peptococcaceae bacterium]
MAGLKERYEQVLTDFTAVCSRCGKKPGEDVKLVAVSKFFPAEDLRRVYDLGQRDFGENRAQEMFAKAPVLPADIRWHFIGRLQRNKVKYIIDKACMIHSVDSLALAGEISRQALLKQVEIPVLLEVNLGGEESKAGMAYGEVQENMRAISLLPGIKIQGLMTIGPYEEDPENSRPLFRRMKELLEEAKSWQIPGAEMKYLSMGMSHDFVAAIEEGANIVRVGSSIFGHRNYN